MLAIIGGTGLYELPGMVIDERIEASTPFGDPSEVVLRGRLNGQRMLFLARHGSGHRLLLGHCLDAVGQVFDLLGDAYRHDIVPPVVLNLDAAAALRLVQHEFLAPQFVVHRALRRAQGGLTSRRVAPTTRSA